MENIIQSAEKLNIKGRIATNYPLAELSSFKVGGNADIAAWPENADDIFALLTLAKTHALPLTILGGGSNILVSDSGVEGLVMFSSAMAGIQHEYTHERGHGHGQLVAGPGARISDVSAYAAEHELAGLAFIYSMPGSTGGAVWMNARCYGSEIADILHWVDYIDVDVDVHADVGADSAPPMVKKLYPHGEDFAYKHSPFQRGKKIILNSAYSLSPGTRGQLWAEMKKNEADRRSKGHFIAPCAGSIFKNDRRFGAPSGKLIDSLNMRGTRIGGAKVSDFHANIIVNDATATASDISALIDLIHKNVMDNLGFDLEAEVIKVGRW